jgi:hypothetical protein
LRGMFNSFCSCMSFGRSDSSIFLYSWPANCSILSWPSQSRRHFW